MGWEWRKNQGPRLLLNGYDQLHFWMDRATNLRDTFIHELNLGGFPWLLDLDGEGVDGGLRKYVVGDRVLVLENHFFAGFDRNLDDGEFPVLLINGVGFQLIRPTVKSCGG